jgi:hypothetical protein
MVRVQHYQAGIEDGDLNGIQPANRGHTKNDQRDMDRMGKRQEFIVSLCAGIPRATVYCTVEHLI